MLRGFRRQHPLHWLPPATSPSGPKEALCKLDRALLPRAAQGTPVQQVKWNNPGRSFETYQKHSSNPPLCISLHFCRITETHPVFNEKPTATSKTHLNPPGPAHDRILPLRRKRIEPRDSLEGQTLAWKMHKLQPRDIK